MGSSARCAACWPTRAASALATRFAAQWLRLPDLDKVQPDILQYPDFDEQLATAMRRETETFFDDLVRRERNVLDLYTRRLHLRERTLARHYGIPNVPAPSSVACNTPTTRARDPGHASVLTLTSHANAHLGRWSAASG
jgi:hypothetical protein